MIKCNQPQAHPDRCGCEPDAPVGYVSGERFAAEHERLRECRAERDQLRADVAILRQHKTDYMEAAEGTRRALLSELQALKAQAGQEPRWRDMATAPRDGTMVRLLVEFTEHATEDADQAPTIGANNFENDGEDRWQFAGWCWSHDRFIEGVGEPVGWLPMLDAPAIAAPPAAQDVSGLVEALEHARLFIRNGIELGYIKMPEADTPDPAHDTLPKIDKALDAHRKAQQQVKP